MHFSSLNDTAWTTWTTPISAARRAYFAALLAALASSVSIMLAIFARYRLDYERTRARALVTTTWWAGGIAVSYGCGTLLPYAIGLDGYPCWLSRLLTFALLPLGVGASFIQQAIFALSTQLSRIEVRADLLGGGGHALGAD